MFRLLIAFEEPGSKPLSVATVEDDELLSQAAKVALQQAAARVASEPNPIVRELRAAEAARLGRVLGMVSAPTVAVM